MENVNIRFFGSRFNLAGEYLQIADKIGYVVADIDIDKGFDTQRLERLKPIDGTLRPRIVVR